MSFCVFQPTQNICLQEEGALCEMSLMCHSPLSFGWRASSAFVAEAKPKLQTKIYNSTVLQLQWRGFWLCNWPNGETHSRSQPHPDLRNTQLVLLTLTKHSERVFFKCWILKFHKSYHQPVSNCPQSGWPPKRHSFTSTLQLLDLCLVVQFLCIEWHLHDLHCVPDQR